LPLFSNTKDKEFWKLSKRYEDNPKNKSQKLYWQDNKYWAKNDEMLLGDTKTGENPIDPFKKERVVFYKKKHDNLSKAMTGNFVAKTVRVRSQKQRWSEFEGPFRSKVPLCEMYPKA
jgi:hypothetical protein